MCQAALELNIPLDPNGIFEDRESVILSKLTTPTNIILTNHQLILDYTHNLSVLPVLSIFDIYNYLLQSHDYDHVGFREYHNLEGYTMFKDGYVLDIQVIQYREHGYFAVRGKVNQELEKRIQSLHCHFTEHGYYYLALQKTLCPDG